MKSWQSIWCAAACLFLVSTPDGVQGQTARRLAHGSPVQSVAFRATTETVASGGANGIVKLWQAGTGQLRRTIAVKRGIVFALAFTPDGRQLVSGNADGTISVFEAQGHHRHVRTLRAHTDRVSSLAFARDGRRLATGSFDGTVRIWEHPTGRFIRTLSGGGGVVWSVAFSPADASLLASGDYSGVVRLWNADTGEVTRTLAGHTRVVTAVGFSADGALIASGSSDGNVCVWRVSTGALEQRIRVSTAGAIVTAVAFLRGSSAVAAATDAGSVRTWNAATGQVLRRLAIPNVRISSLAIGGVTPDLPPDIADRADIGITPILILGVSDGTIRLPRLN
jgi:WD40 repeat protein